MGIILNPDLERRIAEKVKSGAFQSADELIERSLDLLDQRDAAEMPAKHKVSRSVWEIGEEITRSVPDEEWAKLPADLSENLDRYLYGAPKVEGPRQ